MVDDYRALYTEVMTDPAGLGYSGKTDAQIADLMTAKTRSRPRDIIATWEILEATAPADWLALNAAERQRYQTIVSAGQVSVRGANIRSSLVNMFGAGSATRASLVALQAAQVSRSEELGLGDVFGSDITEARRLVNGS